jgi:hypothetical protein
MDPRRKLEEKFNEHERILSSRVPFIKIEIETVFEEQILGDSVKREIIVVKIDKSYLKLYSSLVVFLVFLFILQILLN